MIYSYFELTTKPKKTIINPSNAPAQSICSLRGLMIIIDVLRVSINSFEHDDI